MFLIRVELHDAKYTDYETLHSEMAQRSFSRKVTSSDGTVYHLPTAEYYYNGTGTSDQVLNSAKAAANATGKTSGVIVADATQLKWNGLTKA
jgi:hypothetical protein